VGIGAEFKSTRVDTLDRIRLREGLKHCACADIAVLLCVQVLDGFSSLSLFALRRRGSEAACDATRSNPRFNALEGMQYNIDRLGAGGY
jgi:hypothetical protein